MHKKILLAIGLCFAASVASAGSPATEPPPAPREGLMHATLVVPAAAAKQRAPEQAVVKLALQPETQAPPAAKEENGAEYGMLLAALALMAGIVLRRWGGGRP